ncbi:MAG: DUF5668 domain-containing protein [Patescibacteria group bacterium]
MTARRSKKMIVGAFIIILGIILLLKNIGILTDSVWDVFWSIFWPSLVIAIGLSMIFPKGKWYHCCGMNWGKEKEKEDIKK